ncbi:MAG: energy-coupling factor transporter ATPase [Oscillospiraceae bacterium]|jgi:energy-coupling factor transport system ATP-binding protein|nr:energy-coupling factor transporter ATPase [Oscillospiraceae bacterium]
MKIIEATNLSYAYGNYDENGVQTEGSDVLHGIDFAVEKGSFVSILGSNGSGKSTLAKLFNGILVPTNGTVLVDGMDTKDETKLFHIRRKVGMVFQNPDNQIVAAIVEEDVAFAPENLGVPPDEIRVRIDNAMKTAGIYKYRKHAPHQLSGGQKQRVAIAGVIAMEPECIVFDEPTAMLDPKGREEVITTVRRLNREKGITVILITHYMEEAAASDRVAVMANGRIVADGTPSEIFSDVEQMRKLGLDVPQVTALAYQLNQNGWDLAPDILDEQSCAFAIADYIERHSKG